VLATSNPSGLPAAMNGISHDEFRYSVYTAVDHVCPKSLPVDCSLPFEHLDDISGCYGGSMKMADFRILAPCSLTGTD
jgi:hypothetical protein